MTATVTTAPVTTDSPAATTAFWRPAALAAIGAAVATSAVAAVAHAAGISLAVGGAEIPIAGFAQLTVMCAVVGILIAAAQRRWARSPRKAFVRTTAALTVLSFVPDVLADAAVETKLVLMLTHVVAAAIVIPVVARRLVRQR